MDEFTKFLASEIENGKSVEEATGTWISKERKRRFGKIVTGISAPWWLITEMTQWGQVMSANVAQLDKEYVEMKRNQNGKEEFWGPFVTLSGAQCFESETIHSEEQLIATGRLAVIQQWGGEPRKVVVIGTDDEAENFEIAKQLAREYTCFCMGWNRNILLKVISNIKTYGIEKEIARLAAISSSDWVKNSPNWSSYWKMIVSILPVVEVLSVMFEDAALAEMLGYVMREIVYFSTMSREDQIKELQKNPKYLRV